MTRRSRIGLIAALLMAGVCIGIVLAKREGSRIGAVRPVVSLAPVRAWEARVPSLVVAGGAMLNSQGARGAAPLRDALRVRPVNFKPALSLLEGQPVVLPLFDGKVVDGVITLVRDQPDGRKLAGGPLAQGGHFVLARGREGWSAMVFPENGGQVYQLTTADDGGGVLAEIPRGKVLCASLPPAPRPGGPAASGNAAVVGPVSQSVPVSVPLLDSRPDAEAVYYLDFDGATVVDPVWSPQPIVAADSGLSVADITRVWRRVAEDYRPFRINVTTDPARYAAARPMQRMRCIITTSSAWYGAVGGVARLFSWREAGVETLADDVPCWAFSDQNPRADDIALAVSHEAGHTLGLSHDGLKNAAGTTTDEYFSGQGSGAASWGPIMGAPYGKAVVQWNNGDYVFGAKTANQNEDDVAIIASIANHTGFAAERRSATLSDAGRLAVSFDGTNVDHRGLVEVGGAESWLLLAAGAGPVSLRLEPDESSDPDAANFDGSLTLATAAGVTVATVDTSGTRFPQLNTTVAAGIYVLRVRSVGEGSPAAGGYSAYGSIGRFHVTGSLTAPTGSVVPVVGGAARVEGRVGELLTYQIEAAGAGLIYSVDGLPAGLTLNVDGSVAGMPTNPGVFSANVRAANISGLASRSVVFAIAESGLADAVDAPELSLTTGGDRSWRAVAEAGAPKGASSARSGEVLDGYQTSWLQTTLTGPGRLKWRWKVSSEQDYDFFHARLDGTSVAAISGETSWAEQTLTIGAGLHTFRWSYEKDPYLSVGSDSAWLDDVRWARGYELWAEAAGLAGADAGAASDPDGDGVVNLLEYAFARSPSAADGLAGAVSVALSTNTQASGALELVFARPSNREDLRYTVEVSSDLQVWALGHTYGRGLINGAGLPTEEVSRITQADGSERICVRDASGQSQSSRFIRVRVARW